MNDTNPKNTPPSSQLKDHPVFAKNNTVGIMSGANPYIKEMHSSDGHPRLIQELKSMGLEHKIEHEPTNGKYGSHEPSVLVYNPTREQMFALGRKYGQESVVFGENGKHEILYTNGPNTGKKHLNKPEETVVLDKEPEDDFTVLPNYFAPEQHGYLRLSFDWDKLHDGGLLGEHAAEAARIRQKHADSQNPMNKSEVEHSIPEMLGQIATALKKYIDPTQTPPLATQNRAPAHPHAYEWHDGSTEHHLGASSLQSPALNKEEQPDFDNQTAKAGVGTYAQFAAPYGKIDKTTPSNLFHYDYHGKNDAINKLVQDHGYQTYYAGGKHGKPDLANKNYNTKHLMIYDPSSEAGSFRDQEYTDSWRKIHELAHALTYPELNKMYGEGRRMGKLGHHRNTNEAMRAVHWEWLAAHKQRELSKQIGVHLPEEDFNKELNTVMHDAAHRAVTGKFTEPSQEGFKPSNQKIPLDVALGQVRQAAHNLGLVGSNDLLKKFEGSYSVSDEKEYTISEVRLALAKAMKDRVEKYAEEMRELRTRELQKSEGQSTPSKDFALEWAEYKARVLKKTATMEIDKNLSMGYGEQTTNPPAGGHLSLAEPLAKPPVSEAQRRAMGAAASGHSTLGIPKKVGEKFIEEDKGGKLPEAKKSDSKVIKCKKCSKSHPEMEKCDMSEVKKADMHMPVPCKKCSKSHPEMEKCDMADVKSGADSVKKSVASMTVHDSKAAKAPKGADYSSKQVGSAAVYDVKKPGIFGMLEEKKKMQKYNKTEDMQMSEDAKESSDINKKEGDSDKPFHGYNSKKHSKKGGLNDKYREKYNRETGSDLKRPVTGKVKPDSEAGKRKKSFCARMSGVPGPTSKEGKLTPKGAALKRWNCSKEEESMNKTDLPMVETGQAPKPGEKNGILPGDKPSKKVKIKDQGSGGEIVKKADAPMAKPPSGKNMATATPVASNTSKPGLSKNAGPKLPGMNLKKPKVKLPKPSPTATAQVRAMAPPPEQKPPSNE